MSVDRRVDPDVEQLRLREVVAGVRHEFMRVVRLQNDRGRPLGMEEHYHGSGTWESPLRYHAHPFDDAAHEHEPGSPDAPGDPRG